MSSDILVLALGGENPEARAKIEVDRIRNAFDSGGWFFSVHTARGDLEDIALDLRRQQPMMLHVVAGPGYDQLKSLLDDPYSLDVQAIFLSGGFDLASAEALLELIPCVIGLPAAAQSEITKSFTHVFYLGLAARKDYRKAFAEGLAAIRDLGPSFEELPRFLGQAPEVREPSASHKGGLSLSGREPDDLALPGSPHPTSFRGGGLTGAPLYPLWFGTNREPKDPRDLSRGFGNRRSDRLHYGTCRVSIPKSHKIGSLGSSWLKQLIQGPDGRLRLDRESVRLLARESFWAGLRQKMRELSPDERTALVFLHGYNVSFEDAARRAAQLGADLEVTGAMGFFSWPSRGSYLRYNADETTIQASETFIADFLLEFARESGAEQVHILAHSMGNRGLLRAMNHLLTRVQAASDVPFGEIILAAPDVDHDVFQRLSQAYHRLARRTTLYVSDRDWAVATSLFLHDAPRVGFWPPIKLVEGIDTIEASDVDFSLLGHGYFSESRALLTDMYHVMKKALPKNRQGLRPERTNDGQTYWRMAR